ncbi:MAG TPA: bifunctional 2-C-methyl-D-erythritol 4-phosphate cytidylyltransferase/2-C-methyl-D-erythritol 2,4-cyclodiphosphate synthase [Caulobacteraceae bacterium]
MRFSAVIAAAGVGRRAGGERPKQWRLLAGRPVLRWSAEGLAAAGAERLAVVVAEGERDAAAEALVGLSGVEIVLGGAERADSVKAGLEALADSHPEAVLIHDAARPFVQPRHVAILLKALEHADGAVPVLTVADTLKRDDGGGALATVSRTGLLRVQTPQAFRYDKLAAGYAAWTEAEPPTDDAAPVERAGGKVVAAPGDPMLMKLTYPEDFAMAEALAGQARMTRVGQGFDAHRFGPGEAVWLCGVRIAHDKALVGHSDADAGLHALTDALLGAVGQGDIGDHFPPSDPKWRGAASDQFLRHALDLVRQAGGQVINVDVTLICEEPRIKPHREAMRARLAELLELPLDRISVKATTTEAMGFTGRREGLAAQAMVAVETP